MTKVKYIEHMQTEVKNSTMYNHSKENETLRYILKTNTKSIYWKLQNVTQRYYRTHTYMERLLWTGLFNSIKMLIWP